MTAGSLPAGTWWFTSPGIDGDAQSTFGWDVVSQASDVTEEGGAATLDLVVDGGQSCPVGDLDVTDEVEPLDAED